MAVKSPAKPVAKPAAKAAVKPAPAVKSAAPKASPETFAPAAGLYAPAEPAELMEAASQQLADVNETVRRMAESGLAQGRQVYARLRDVTEGATGSMEASFSAATQGVTDLNVKAITAMKASADAAFAFAIALAGVKSMSEAVSVASDHTRQQIETFAGQSAEFVELARKVAHEAMAPIQKAASAYQKAA